MRLESCLLGLGIALSTTPSLAAEVVRLGAANWHLVPRGKEVDAIYGDTLMRNDKVVAVIADVAPTRAVNSQCPNTQGAVIDFTLRSVDNDQLTAFMPHSACRVDGKASPHPAYTEAEVLAPRGREVRFRVRRPPSSTNPVESVTEYALRDGDAFLRVETRHRNTGREPVRARLADYVRCDYTFVQAAKGVFEMVYFYDPWFRAAYGVVRADAALRSDGTGGTSRDGTFVEYPELLPSERERVAVLAPGQTVAVTRHLVTGRHLADLQAAAAGLLGRKLSRLDVAVADGKGRAAAGADVKVMDAAREVSAAFTDGRGRARFAVPAGRYRLVVSQIGRATAEASVDVAAGAPSTRVTVAALAQAQFAVTDGDGKPGPCKVQFIGTSGTPDPDLGPVQRADGCKNLYFSATGRFTTPVPPGKYRLVISRGPEHDAATREVEIREGETTQVTARLPRVVSSPGWVSADFHNHSTESGDNTTSAEGRIAALVAEGVEFAASTEHNRIQSYRPRLRAMGLDQVLATSDGIELSGAPLVLNHHNAFPLLLKARTQDGGGPATDADPRIQIKRLHDHDARSEKLVQQNHPEMGWLYFDKDGDGRADAGFGTLAYTHVIEIWKTDILDLRPFDEKPSRFQNGAIPNNRIFNWLQLLNQGARLPGVANTDAHNCFHDSGVIRNYVRSSTDLPGRIDEMEIVREAKRGHMVMTNGPFMEVSFDGALPGDDASVGADGKGILRVRVECANWLDADRVQVLVNGRPDRSLNFTRASHPAMFAPGVVKFRNDIPIALGADAHLIVVAIGEKASTSPVMGPEGSRPIAISNPIFVDVDGRGFQPNRDTLGAKLPTRPRPPARDAGAREAGVRDAGPRAPRAADAGR